MEPQAQSVIQQNNMLTAEVTYQDKRTRLYKAPKGKLSYSDNVLRFYDQTGVILVELPLQTVKKIKRNNMSLTVYDNAGEYHIFWFKGAATASLLGVTGGTIGLIAGDAGEIQSGIENWVIAIKERNPMLPMGGMSWKDQWKFAFIASAVLIGLLMLTVIILALMQL